MKEHNATTLIKRLSSAGFKGDFVRLAILPDWWDEECARDASVLPEIELRIARFLESPLATIRNPLAPLPKPEPSGTQLRRVGSVDPERIKPAIHAAIAIAGAVVRSLRQPAPPNLPPANAIDWRAALDRPSRAVNLTDVCSDLWKRGVPVIPLDLLPEPKFQGAACLVEGRPVVLIGHRNDEPARVAFLVGHEVGHLVAGDCTDGPVIDEEEVPDGSDMESRADRFAQALLLGDTAAPDLTGGDFRQLARRALAAERDAGAEASAVLFAWAARSGNYAAAVQATKALYRATGARRTLQDYFRQHVDIESASETDRGLLQCVATEPDRLAAAG